MTMTGEGLPRPVFQLADAVPEGPDRDVLGLWASVADPVPDDVAFDATAAETPEMQPVWRADYPSDPELIEKHLEEAHRALEAADAALLMAPGRLDAYVAQGQAGVAFAAPGLDVPPSEPEDELTLLLGEIRGDGMMVSFDPSKPDSGKWDLAYQAFQEFTDRLKQMVGHLAQVETCVEGRLVGRTSVSWTGDVDTMVLDWLDVDQVRLHQQTLDLALASRRTMLRTSSLAITSAIKLSVLLATPGGLVLALPVVLRFIRLLRKELKSKNEKGG
jgi:hypothetical protein